MDEITKEELASKQKELDEKEQKLKAYAQKLKIESDELLSQKAEIESVFKSELDGQKRVKLAEYESKISSELTAQYEAKFKKLVNDYETKLREILEKQSKFEQERQDLEIKKANLDSQVKAQEAKLEADFKTKLDNEYVKQISDYEHKLSDEFTKKFKEKIDELNQKEQEYLQKFAEIQIQESKIRAREDSLQEEQEYYENNTEQRYKNKIDELESDKRYLQDVYDDLKQEYSTLMLERDEYAISVENRDLIVERDNAKNELNKAKIRISELEKKNSEQWNKFHSELEEIRKEKDAQQTKLELNNELNEKVSSLQKEIENYKVRLQDDEYWKGRYDTEHRRLEEFQKIYLGKGEQKNRAEAISQEYHKEIKIENNNKLEEKNEIKWLENIENGMNKYGVKYPQRLLYAFHTTLKSATMSPLSILSGVSGTGKSELPKLYAYFGGFNFLAEAVQPTWDSPASMMGFYNMIEGKFDSKNILKFLIQTSFSSKFKDPDCINPYGLNESMNIILLDEMNLAHIELYFAEFLSKFEARRGSKDVDLDIQIGAGMHMSIKLDTNLLWVGTMNEDETTKNLSDKVLDRAYCLNFPRPTKLIDRPKITELVEISDFKWLPKQTWQSWLKTSDDFNEKQKEVLKKFREQTDEVNNALKPTGRAIGHRVWQSMASYIANHPLVTKDDDKEKAMQIAYEDQLVQKIMPKLRGIETSGVELKALESIRDIIKDTNLVDDFNYALRNSYGLFKFNSADYLEK